MVSKGGKVDKTNFAYGVVAVIKVESQIDLTNSLWLQ